MILRHSRGKKASRYLLLSFQSCSSINVLEVRGDGPIFRSSLHFSLLLLLVDVRSDDRRDFVNELHGYALCDRMSVAFYYQKRKQISIVGDTVSLSL